jgi:large subunit ribosomal protein L23
MMSMERNFTVIRVPHVSEKTTRVQANDNQYVFKVSADATKTEIKSAVEAMFKGYRKAYVSLAEGQAIDFGVKV